MLGLLHAYRCSRLREDSGGAGHFTGAEKTVSPWWAQRCPPYKPRTLIARLHGCRCSRHRKDSSGAGCSTGAGKVGSALPQCRLKGVLLKSLTDHSCRCSSAGAGHPKRSVGSYCLHTLRESKHESFLDSCDVHLQELQAQGRQLWRWAFHRS